MWYNEQIKKLILPADKVLDLGSAEKMSFRGVKCAKYVGVDIFAPFMPDVVWDLSKTPYPFADSSYEVATALDMIEHLEREEGFAMLREMERIAKRLLIIFTPADFRTNENNVKRTGNKHNYHCSLWTKEDFKDWNFLDYKEKGYIFCWKAVKK